MDLTVLENIGLGRLVKEASQAESVWAFLETNAPRVGVRLLPSEYPDEVDAWKISPTEYLVVETHPFFFLPAWMGERIKVDPLPDGTVVFRGMIEPFLMDHFEWSGSFGGHGSPESEAILACGGEWESASITHTLHVHIPRAETDRFLSKWQNFVRPAVMEDTNG